MEVSEGTLARVAVLAGNLGAELESLVGRCLTLGIDGEAIAAIASVDLTF